jgi:hydrogenase nickel incorporation protein HypA/HybF
VHELSIAHGIVTTVTDAAEQIGPGRIRAVHLRVGALSGVMKESLLFCYDIAVSGTPLEGSELQVEELPVIVYCQACDLETELSTVQSFRCGKCGEASGNLRQGKELEVVSVEVDSPEVESRVTNEHACT